MAANCLHPVSGRTDLLGYTTWIGRPLGSMEHLPTLFFAAPCRSLLCPTVLWALAGSDCIYPRHVSPRLVADNVYSYSLLRLTCFTSERREHGDVGETCAVRKTTQRTALTVPDALRLGEPGR